MAKKKKVCIVLGNGVSIDFLNHLSKEKPEIWNGIDVSNLFSHGAKLKWPSNKNPGFLSKKYTPNLWDLGARPYLSKTETMEIIEKIVTSVNVYALTGSNDIGPDQKYLRAYKELTSYLKYLFIDYNNKLADIPDDISDWSWAKYLKSLNDSSVVEEVVIITYNYDIWLERVLLKLGIEFELPPMTKAGGDCKFRLFKPHGSISFKYKEDLPLSSFNINYQGLKADCSATDIQVKYDDLCTNNPIIFLIPPAGDVNRTRDGWNASLRQIYEPKIKELKKDDLMIISGISYWHVDRAEIDNILIAPSDEIDMVNINPSMDQYFESVINSLFKNYIHFDGSDILSELVL
ncbi:MULTISPECIES: hypothetical protein [Pseudomonadati]|uniref:SIR2-like domain-containing protein n=1 Tax=Shewanella aestuarii TaxID=1028752 RepID=A0ABT0KX77_9GAMM|nr:hypothetical protein [Shewanella aestuarii]MCL1115865.1 hypothetical protein [Shewanella aestuarii]GGN69252.1 hypothetical protein GCM10009193_02970 [Shewanella aestuarii]